ncbi:MAG: hypothetical protein WCK60_01555 [Candidatus Nomurabacteria bacterium]
METIQYFLSKLFIFASVFGVIILIFIGLQKFAPGFVKKFSFVGGSSSFFTDNWLPDPVDLQKLSQPKIADLSNLVLEGGMTPGMSYVIYGEKGMQIVKVPGGTNNGNGKTAPVLDSSSLIRNLSLFKGQDIRQGMTFFGEAKSTFFNESKTFPIYILDSQNRVFANEMAVATNQWASPGWTRFSVKLYANFPPTHQSCQMVFSPDKDSPDRSSNYRVALPIACN